MNHRLIRTLAAIVLGAFVALPASADTTYSTVNKAIRVDDHSDVGSLDSVNGSIRVGAASVVRSAETVNGSITVDEGSTVGSVSSVNGSIRLDEGVIVERGIESVNGSVTLKGENEVGGDIETVNGAMRMTSTKVTGGLTTVNGSIDLADGSEVFGDILVKKPRGWNWNKQKPVKVRIGKNSVVHGNLVFEHEVELDLDESAKIGRIVGDEVKFVGADPRR